MKKTFIKKTEQGFTIIETLVAITILMVAIVGPLTVANKGLIASVYARDQMIGSYLAQDAMEFLKNKRDNNKLASSAPGAWLTGISDVTAACSSDFPCSIDTIHSVRASCAGPTAFTCGRLYIVDTGLSNGYVVGNSYSDVATQFYRKFYLTTLQTDGSGNPIESRLSVVVEWKNGTLANSVTLQSIIYDTFH